MSNHIYIPKGKLSPYVKLIWYNYDYTPRSAVERVLPSGAPQLIINLGNKQFRHFKAPGDQQKLYNHTIVTGIHTGHKFLDSYTRIATMGVVLRPGGINALFDIPAQEFCNQVIQLNDVLALDTSALREQLIDTTAPQEKFQLLESFLITQLNKDFCPNPGILRAVKLTNNQNGIKTISEIADVIGYSRRQLQSCLTK